MSEKLKSRKFWFALLGAILPIVAQVMTEEVALSEALQLSIGILGAYIFGQAYVDGKAVEGATESSGEAAEPTEEASD
tara:strand:+ start:1281 stop:1514 length:234 start_codon:yes stop_codon:yes gene_type:complete